MTFCGKCGAKNPDDADFCFRCGSKLTHEEHEEPIRGEDGFPIIKELTPVQKQTQNYKLGVVICMIAVIAIWLYAVFFFPISYDVWITDVDAKLADIMQGDSDQADLVAGLVIFGVILLFLSVLFFGGIAGSIFLMAAFAVANTISGDSGDLALSISATNATTGMLLMVVCLALSVLTLYLARKAYMLNSENPKPAIDDIVKGFYTGKYE